jgi:hypothetical protein
MILLTDVFFFFDAAVAVDFFLFEAAEEGALGRDDKPPMVEASKVLPPDAFLRRRFEIPDITVSSLHTSQK